MTESLFLVLITF